MKSSYRVLLPHFLNLIFNLKTLIMEEIWKDIENFEGLYQVSNLGRIKSLKRTVLSKNQVCEFNVYLEEKIIVPGLDTWKYYRIGLSKNSVRTTIKVHREVAKAFIPNPENKKEVNHLNGLKTDNRVENLEWSTSLENMRHAYKTGLHVNWSGEKANAAVLTEKEVKCIRHMYFNLGYTLKRLGLIFSISPTMVGYIKQEKYWTHV
jgi:hypothetical protein